MKTLMDLIKQNNPKGYIADDIASLISQFESIGDITDAPKREDSMEFDFDFENYFEFSFEDYSAPVDNDEPLAVTAEDDFKANFDFIDSDTLLVEEADLDFESDDVDPNEKTKDTVESAPAPAPEPCVSEKPKVSAKPKANVVLVSNAPEAGRNDEPVYWSDEDVAVLRYGLLEHALKMVKEVRGPAEGQRGRESFNWLMAFDEESPFSSVNCAKCFDVDMDAIRRFLLEFDKEKGYIFTT